MRKLGWAVKLCFRIALHVKDIGILDKIYEYFNGGLVSSDVDCRIRFESLKDLDLVITHFDKFPLRTKKKIGSYLLFRLWDD